MRRLPKQQKLRTPEYFCLAMLALYAVSVFNLGGYILVLMLGAYLVLHLRSVRISLLSLSLMLFSFFYFCFYMVHFSPGVTEVFNYLIAPWAAFLFGEIFTRKSSSRRAHYYVIGVLALGFFAHGLLNLIAYLVHSSASGGRNAYDFWRQEWISVTANGLYYPMALGLAFGVLFSDFRKKIKLLAVTVVAVAGVNAALLGHRTSLYIIALLLLYNVVSTLLRSHMSAWKKARFVIAGTFILLLLVIAYVTDLAGLRTWIESTSLFLRMTNASAVHSTDRMEIWKSFFKQAIFYPFGGAEFQLANNQSWVHNLWFDVYYKVGVFPFVFLIVSTAIITNQYFALRKLCRRNENIRFMATMTNLYLAFLLSFAVEPVIDANPYVMISFFMITGCVSGVLKMGQEALQ